MIKGNGNAKPVSFSQSHAFPDPKAIVEDVMVRQHRAFGKAGRPRSVLNIDDIIEFQLALAFREAIRRGLVSPAEQSLPGEHSRWFVRSQVNDSSQAGKAFTIQRVRSWMTFQLWDQLKHHPCVIGLLKSFTSDEQVALGLAQRKLELVAAVSRVDGHEN